ncbi:iron-containing alcohol dehydrogenase [Dictyoglomus thermophilum]|uniref:Iron containing alcohol dehydrogenase n=1 Tax=Dictyoglomus thermophilum (strain ATCC 35947 / DSM 3960 / H-6-12) TaxID=309799 RepID=B5YA69_DICT6|nr:iron-containing alcohol dehydrogenase [Dictyoglomus thermophilum]ACI19360.1 iron containing alcohol dehydrogenase [Dictyoglomus thermophilum H-6-12]
MQHFNFYIPVMIKFGIGLWEKIPEESYSLGAKKVLIVTGKKHLKSTGILDKLLNIYNNYPIDVYVFDEVPPEPPYYIVDQGAEIAKTKGIDLVIGIGGGSALDVAKAIAVKVNLPGTIWDYIGDNSNKITIKGLPTILVPTTAGTASEVTRVSVLINPETKEKLSIRHDFLYATLAIIDPYLTLSLPKENTAYSGIDAFIHSLESFLSVNSNMVTEPLALTALRTIYKYLPRVYNNLERIDLREKVLYASTISGIAFTQTGLGGIHALAHPIGVYANIPHGLACALVTIPTLEYNLEILSREKISALGRAIGVYSLRSAKEKILKKIDEFFSILNIKLGLHNYGIKWEDLPNIAQEVPKSGSYKTNPRTLNYETVLEILKKAF